MTTMLRSTLVVAIGLIGMTQSASAKPTTPPPPKTTVADPGVAGSVETHKVAPGTAKGADAGGNPIRPQGTPLSANIAKPHVRGAAQKDKIEVKYGPCTPGTANCDGARTGCITQSGDPNYFDPPTVTYVRVNNGPWDAVRVSCGVPDSVTIPGAPGEPPATVAVEPPPVPTFAQIQTAFKELPFSKPSVSVQPKGMRTLINLPTYYEASWPDDAGLEPGEVSKPVTLLSWTVEFKISARDYRYDFGDDTTSRWTSSAGGTYPDGDVTHTYTDTGDMDVKVDARLTGQYRVNGGAWQDIATTADLQDEPVDTLEVVGTRTRLTS